MAGPNNGARLRLVAFASNNVPVELIYDDVAVDLTLYRFQPRSD